MINPTSNITYFDNASTSYPKPQNLTEQIVHYLNHIGASPGRGGHYLEKQAAEIVEHVRRKLASLLGVKKAENLAFTHNGTHASNIVLKGLLKPGDHVVISNFEHNAVFRPIHRLSKENRITYDIWESNFYGEFDITTLESLIKPETKLIALNHASNVLGVLSPVLEVAAIAKKRKVALLIDVAQTAGLIPTNFGEISDYITGTAHKSLLGPPGIGFLYVKDENTLSTLYEGGSGSLSASPYHPETLPLKFEAGTCNYLGIAGLKGSLEYIDAYGSDKMLSKLMDYTKNAIELLKAIPGLIFYGPESCKNKIPLISFNLKGYFANELAYLLEKKSIYVRPGIQCAPLIHKTLKTLPHGTVRLSFGHQNTHSQLELLQETLKSIQRKD